MILNAKREANWIDALKGMGMVLIFLGHIPEYDSYSKLYLYTFHVALFFVIAGYLFNEKKQNARALSEILKAKVKEYIIPYFVMSGINLLISVAMHIKSNGMVGLSDRLATWLGAILYVYSPDMPNCATLWFLPCFFVAYILFAMWQRIDGIIAKVVAIIGILGIGLASTMLIPVQLPWYIQIAPIATFFMALGWSIRQLLNRFDEMLDGQSRKIQLLVEGIAVVAFIFLLKANRVITFQNSVCVSLNELQIGNPLIFITGAICATFGMLILFKYTNLRSRILSMWGRGTMLGMGFNLLFMEIAFKITEGPWYLVLAIILVIYSLLCVATEYISRKR